MRDKQKKGGNRKGAGVKPKYNEETKTVAFRCTLSKVDELKLIVKSKHSGVVGKIAANGSQINSER